MFCYLYFLKLFDFKGCILQGRYWEEAASTLGRGKYLKLNPGFEKHIFSNEWINKIQFIGITFEII